MADSTLSLSMGDTYMTIGTSIRNHLWVVVSDLAQDEVSVVSVNLTSYTFGKDDSCILKKGDHPFIHHDTIISYADALIVPIHKLSKLYDLQQLELHEPFAREVLLRIQRGLINSPHAPNEIKSFLVAQGLVP